MFRKILLFLPACFLLFLNAPCSIAEGDGATSEWIKGTIAMIAENELYLMGASFSDESLGVQDVMVVLDADTRYYAGIKQISRSELERGNIVLVRCGMGGKFRKAFIVRVIGEKKP